MIDLDGKVTGRHGADIFSDKSKRCYNTLDDKVDKKAYDHNRYKSHHNKDEYQLGYILHDHPFLYIGYQHPVGTVHLGK